jgi:hypothetical protein
MTDVRLAMDISVHKMPPDLKKVLLADDASIHAWNTITPLARNEWICWIDNAKLIETRNRRIQRTHDELIQGKRRPCCWIGCIHRTDKAISPSVQATLNKTLGKDTL